MRNTDRLADLNEKIKKISFFCPKEDFSNQVIGKLLLKGHNLQNYSREKLRMNILEKKSANPLFISKHYHLHLALYFSCGIFVADFFYGFL